MKEKQQLIEEIEGASDELIKEVLYFLLLTKSKAQLNSESSEEADNSYDSASIVKSQKSLKSLLLEIPEVGKDVDFERRSDIGRDIDL